MVSKLCPTDARFRPDQRALEHGDIDLAQSEKIRLEQKQRNKRKEREEKNEIYKPRWFKEEQDDKTGETVYRYLGGFWEAKKSGLWPQDLEDIH